MKNLVLLLALCALPCYAYNAMPESQANQIADKIYRIEGGANTRYPYGIKSVKTHNPRRVCLNTIKNNYVRWQAAGARGDFLNYLCDVFCPKKSDPQGNKNWRNNIHKV